MSFGLLVDIEAAATYCLIDVETLRAWTQSRHAPHYFLGGVGPLYKKSEIKAWVDKNLLTHHKGMPVPRKMEVITPVTAFTTGSPPLPLAAVDTLLHVPVSATCSGIYFLSQGDDVVYVGQAVQVIARCASHILEGVKQFDHDRIFFLPCPLNQLDEMERQWIVTLRPRYNKTHAKVIRAHYAESEPT